MAGPVAFLRRIWRTLRHLHLGLYFLFYVMIALGGIVATVFEQYSIADLKSGLIEAQRRTRAAGSGGHAPPGRSPPPPRSFYTPQSQKKGVHVSPLSGH